MAGAATATSLSESTIDAAIRAGILPVRRHGNRTLILARDLERWLDSLPSGRCTAPAHLEGRRTGRRAKAGHE
ncbi:MAG TPA: DNA-binding protein [Gallionellaceae bacterium]|nr:DNA-binding protein [Gallionellaceae bacterium]